MCYDWSYFFGLLPTEVELWLFDILVLEVAAVDDDELVVDVVPAPPDSEEPEAFIVLSMAVSNISAVCLLCLTAEDAVGCLELLCCLLFSECADDEAVVVPVEADDEEAFGGPEFKPDEPLDLISLDILLSCFCALEKI